jgi:hypothetical protein
MIVELINDQNPMSVFLIDINPKKQNITYISNIYNDVFFLNTIFFIDANQG